MSFSKMFSDLPELTYEIIKYFRNDFSTLHSCILVNRLWCRLTIPLLWENPFSIPTRNYNFIDIYLNNLNDDFKSKLNEYKINNSLPLNNNNTLFNYPKFLKYLNTYNFIDYVNMWIDTSTIKTSIPKNKIYSISDFRKLIDILLFKTFIENEVNLNTLEIDTSNIYYNLYYDIILELILQNTNFIHNIKNLKLHIVNYNENVIIKISQIINLHQNLKKIFIENNYLPLYKSFLLLKGCNCSNTTLNTIIFYHINFKGINNLDKVFKQLNVLESLHIIYCSLNTVFTQQIINLNKSFKLKSLFINEESQIDESLLLLLKKSGDYLENLGFSPSYKLSLILKQQLLESFIKYNKNMKFLDFSRFENQFIYLTLNLIENVKQNLNYLAINVYENFQSYIIEYSSIILQNLGQILPHKLEYLSLILCIKESDMEIFLKNSQNIFIKKFLINLIHNRLYEDSNILPHIKEYIMKKKRVKYLAIIGTFSEKYPRYGDLSYFKNEVEEFKLHDIKVQCYYDLLFNIHDFAKKIN
ncbi:hypothetical protein RhiirA1_460871 [Rhizophagus irregularis]|uniref:F-box domain-containing protein n=1 Tax=Rhizophagus irregularis TaxID=588596 RepID=A0A2N0RQJ8_9GLOM|nr:hypothetical protein RhiirA1_460871 [Rhizophagus irregularis]